MNPVEINKLELNITDRIATGADNKAILEYIKTYTDDMEDLVQVIRQIYNELQDAREDLL